MGPVAEVKVAGGRVHIQATAAPVSEILDRLARTTGMKVVYDGAPPSDRLTAAIDAGSETEALSRLLEGLGLTYAFKLDATGRHVETLFVTSASTRRASTATTSSAPRPIQFQPTADDYEPENAPEPADPVNDPAAMAAGVPDSAGISPGNPGYAGGQAGGQSAGKSAGKSAECPELRSPRTPPSRALRPSPGSPSPANPGMPTFPGPASYP